MSSRTENVKVNFNEELSFQAIDWIECDETLKYDDTSDPKYMREHNKKYTIFCFGVTNKGHTICVKITDYKPYFHMKIPDEWTEKEIKKFDTVFFKREKIGSDKDYDEFETEEEYASDSGKTWMPKTFEDKIKTPYWKTSLLNEEIIIEKHEIFWTFMNNKKHNFWKLPFRSKTGAKLFHNYLKDEQTYIDFKKKPVELGFKLFHSDIEPLLKFFHDSKIKPSSWIKIKGNTFTTKYNQSYCQINIETSWKNIEGFENAAIAPLVIASFDIECDSSHGDFPLPKKDCKKLANQLVIAFLRDKAIIKKNDKSSQKSIDKTKNAMKNVNGRHKFFRERILQGLDFKKDVDDDISLIYFKSRKDLKKLVDSDSFNKLCRTLHNICDRPIRKIKANQHMKKAVNTVNIRFEKMEEAKFKLSGGKKCSINDLIGIIKDIARSRNVNFMDLRDKIITKEVLVKFANYELSGYFPGVKGDQIIQIGTVFWRFGDDKPFYNNLISLKECGEIDGTDVKSFDNETDVLLEWTRMIKKQKPDILLTYNGLGFDETFMNDRAEELFLKGNIKFKRKNKQYQEFINFGRFDKKIYSNVFGCEGGIIAKKLASSALGSNYLYYFNCPGIVQIDLLKVAQAGLTKFPSYKLDNIAEYYISGDILKVGDFELEDINITDKDKSNWIQIKNVNQLEVGNYIIISLVTYEQFKGGKKIIVTDIDTENIFKDKKGVSIGYIKLGEEVPATLLEKKPTWGIAKDDVGPQDIFNLYKKGPKERAIIGKYCIQDCALVIRLLRKLETIPNNFGMSNVCLVPFSFIFMRGQGIKISSLIINECCQNGYLLPVLDKQEDVEDEEETINLNKTIINPYEKGNIGKFDTPNNDDGGNDSGFESGNEGLDDNFNVVRITDDGYEGAIVLEPIPGLYLKDPIAVLDFSSLYPSEMIASNLSHDSLCENEYWLGEEGAKRIWALGPGYDFIDKEYDVFTWIDSNNHVKGKHKTGTKVERFVQFPDGKKGLLPMILKKLLDARKATKILMKDTKDPFKASIYDGLQLAYKVTANSLYGQTGATTSKIYKKAIAAATTAGGRECIHRARDYCLANNPGCEVVYGDSIPSWEIIHIIIKIGNEYKLFIDTIENVCRKYFQWNNGKENEKQYYVPKNIGIPYTNTDIGKTKILSVMKHKSKNSIIKIITDAGNVNVTDEHSIILENGKIITPRELNIGDVLLTHNNEYPSIKNDKKGVVREIINLGKTNDYVYDLTTENHHFQAGNGSIVVHNTDSVFLKLNLVYEDGTYPKTDKEKVQRCIDIGLWLQHKLKDDGYFKPPHDLEYEKVFYPFMLISKKRYAGIKTEFDVNKNNLATMGLAIKRREYAPILKYIFYGVLMILMYDKSVRKAQEFVDKCCKDLMANKFDLNMFVMSKTLRDYYKDPESVAHKVLADRMAERDPGNKPASNERIPYAYIQVKERPDMLQGDKIEHVNYIKENNCQLDYVSYMEKQILKPISQIFGLAIEELKGYPYKHGHFENLYPIYFNKYDKDKKKTNEKITKLKCKIIGRILFGRYIKEAYNKQNGITEITKWFKVISKDNDDDDIDAIEEMEMLLEEESEKKKQLATNKKKNNKEEDGKANKKMANLKQTDITKFFGK